MKLFDKHRQFWVIFDTSQYPAYYRDVHDLLAAPVGHVLRYQYADAWLSPKAQQFVTSGTQLPILLAYAQKNSEYKRGEKKSEPVDVTAPTVFILTRLGRMRNIVREGSKVYFDFEVGSYPDNAKTEAISGLLGPLVTANEVPWDKWVTVSESQDLFREISEGTDEDNWARIVELLGRAPIQFANDAFWRLKGPFKKNGDLIKPALRKVRQNSEVRRISSEYVVRENKSMHLQIVSSIPEQVSADRPQYLVEAEVTGSEKLKVIGSGGYELRHYDEKSIEYVSLEMSPFKTDAADLVLQTTPSSEIWTAGAKLDIRHSIRKSHWISLLGVVSGVVGLTLSTLGASELFKNDALNGFKILMVGLLLLVATKYILTGKLEFGK
jgi:hypothetical protein